jgi:hypothetical protein
MKGENRLEYLHAALIRRGLFLVSRSKLIHTKVTFEESYKVIPEAYIVTHPEVLKSGLFLLNIFAATGAIHLAERYARVYYEGFNQLADTESELLADASHKLAETIHESIGRKEGEDVVETEILSRKAVRIKESFRGPDSLLMLPFLSTLLATLGPILTDNLVTCYISLPQEETIKKTRLKESRCRHSLTAVKSPAKLPPSRSVDILILLALFFVMASFCGRDT